MIKSTSRIKVRLFEEQLIQKSICLHWQMCVRECACVLEGELQITYMQRQNLQYRGTLFKIVAYICEPRQEILRQGTTSKKGHCLLLDYYLFWLLLFVFFLKSNSGCFPLFSVPQSSLSPVGLTVFICSFECKQFISVLAKLVTWSKKYFLFYLMHKVTINTHSHSKHMIPNIDCSETIP